VTQSDWVLHLVPVNPFSLSEEPGAKAVGLSFTQLRFGLKLPGPVAGSPYRWSFFFRNGTAQAVEATARLVWVSAKGDPAPKEVASWAVANITPTDPKTPNEVAPRHGVVANGLDLLNALPGDTLVLEITGPVDAAGKPALELVVGGSDNQVGDSLVGLANGPAVTLGLEPSVLNASVGGKYPFKATVRVGGGAPVEGALIRWECRASDSGPPPGSISQDGVLSAVGEGNLQVVAHYTGKEAVATVSIGKAMPQPPSTPSGDVNGDGIVGVADATLALRAAVGLIGLDTAALARTDMNNNGKADIADATMILRKAVGLS